MAGKVVDPSLRSTLFGKRPTTNVILSKEIIEKAQADFIHRRSEARKLQQDLPQEEDFHR